MQLEAWACLGGVEIVNGHRVLSYVAELGGQRFQVPTCESECCLCATLGDETYSRPDTDPAPWYESGRPDSADFLGVYALPELPSVLRRSQVALVGGGSIIGPMLPLGRTIPFSGTMYASTPRGMAYGERWLTEVLAGSMCRSDCAADTLELLPTCPVEDPDPEEGSGSAFAYGEAMYGESPYGYGDDFTVSSSDLSLPWMRQVLKAGIGDGPIFTPIGTGCFVQEVQFQVVAGVPYLFGRPEVLFDGVVLDGETQCVYVVAPEWPGDVTTRITITAGSGDGNQARVTATPTTSSTCPDEGGNPCVDYTVELPGFRQLVIDSRAKSVLEYLPQKVEQRNGYPRIIDGTLPPFIDLAPCAQLCLCIESLSGDLDVQIERFTREL